MTSIAELDDILIFFCLFFEGYFFYFLSVWDVPDGCTSVAAEIDLSLLL